MLQIENLTLEFIKGKNKYKALDGVSFNIARGEIVGLVGESGCGKSLTSLAIMGLLPSNAMISEGNILFGNRDLTKLGKEEFYDVRGKEISMIFQDPMSALNPLITVGKQIEEAYMVHNKVTYEEAYARTQEIMKKVGLSRIEKLYDEYPHQLSGGMRQRIMIAMALINKPAMLIADEPTTALDVTIQAQILELMKKLNREEGSAIMIISHDLGVISELCDTVAVMYSGSIVEEGPVEEVFSTPLHPYTKGLLEAIPTMDKKGTELYTIRGMVPGIYDRNSNGCCFADRCPKAEQRCYLNKPEIKSIKNRRVNCFKVKGE